MTKRDLDPLEGDAHWRERVAFVTDTMREMSRQVDPHEMVETYSKRMRGLRGDRLLSLSRRGVDPPEFVLARDSDWDEQPNPWRQRGRLPHLRGGLLGDLAYGDEVRLIQSLELAPDDPHQKLLDGYGSLLAIPVFDGGEGKNVVVFLRREREAFDPDAVPRSVWTTNLFGRATHNLVISRELEHAHERLDREHRRVADVQRSLLPPELPKIPSLDLAVSYRPALRAGGDYYDILPVGDGRWCIVVADVSGHGSSAAVQMAVTRTLTHVFTETDDAPGALLAFMNERFVTRVADGPYAFVTVFCALWDERTRKLRYANAGHHPPRVKRCRDGTFFSLDDTTSPPVGVLDGIAFEEAEVDLMEGDQLLMYTDGLVEAFGPDQELFGSERLDRTIANCGIDARALVEDVEAALAAFTEGRELADDVTLLVARVRA